MFINFSPITKVVGVLLVMVGVVMLTCIPISILTGDNQSITFLYSGFSSIGIGSLLWLARVKGSQKITKREGCLIVVLSWLAVSILCMLPYLFSGAIDDIHNAFFESVSGVTTTGATILKDIEAVPPSILYWRSLTQWLGGMGIIVLTIALFPLLGIAGIELFTAEAPGPTSDKIHPRIKDTARTLWFVYVGLTVVLTIILMVEGMSWYDAINHSYTTMATGGFSTKNASIAYFDSPLIQYTLIIFMFIAGTNFAVIYFGLTGKIKRVYRNEEFRMYVIVVVLISVFMTCALSSYSIYNLEESFRAVTFSVISVMTTTGYITHDFTQWGNGFIMCFFILFFSGACAGSTSGGVKLIRHLVFLRNSLLEFKRILHPRAMIRLKVNKEIVAPRILTHILVYLLVHLILISFGAIFIAFLNVDFVTAMGASASALGNVGPAIGSVGPVDNYAHLPNMAKYLLSFLMICGRLELFTVLIIFTPYFWKDN